MRRGVGVCVWVGADVRPRVRQKAFEPEVGARRAVFFMSILHRPEKDARACGGEGAEGLMAWVLRVGSGWAGRARLRQACVCGVCGCGGVRSRRHLIGFLS